MEGDESSYWPSELSLLSFAKLINLSIDGRYFFKLTFRDKCASLRQQVKYFRVVEAESDIAYANVCVFEDFGTLVEFGGERVLDKCFECHYWQTILGVVWSSMRDRQ